MRFLRLGKGCPRRFEGIEFMDDDMKAALGLLEDVDSDQVTDVPQSQPSRRKKNARSRTDTWPAYNMRPDTWQATAARNVARARAPGET
jgi:hypothetical protein